MKKLIINLPNGVSRLQASILEKLPGKVFTMDNYLSLQQDSICPDSDMNLRSLGITPTHMDSIVPVFLNAKSERNRYLDLRTVSDD